METARFSDMRLLEFARRLQSAEDYPALLREVCREVREAVGYNTAWIAVYMPEQRGFKVLTADGPFVPEGWTEKNIIPLEGDAYISEIYETGRASVVEDAQTDPRVNREIVEELGNRTVINVPMTLLDQPFGTLGTGTFKDEGVRLPTDDEMRYLHALAQHVVVASARILLALKRDEEARRTRELELMLARRQRLESLGELAGGIAHDFNNLLTVIRSSTDLLADELGGTRHVESLRMIDEAARSAGELTNRLLALGRRQPLQLAPLDINQRLESVAAMVRRLLPASIEIEVSAGVGLPFVRGDRVQIEQVVMNMCLNARDAMPEGGSLTLRTERVELSESFVRENPWAKAGEFVMITISDTGTGMTPETLERIFEPFFTTKKDDQGSGLGLAVSNGIVEQHGGMVHAYSEPGIGTSFKVYLPVTGSATEPGRIDFSSPPRGSGEHVLVADDQENVRRVIERLLTRAGYQVTTVVNGVEAVAATRRQRFDLVVLDAVMPEMGGREAFEQIHAEDPGLPAMFVSGYGGEEVTTRFLRDLDVPLLAKPFGPEELLHTVRDALDGRAGRVDAIAAESSS